MRVFLAASPRTLAWEHGGRGCPSPVRRLPAPVPSVGFSTSGRVGSSSGTWLAALGPPAPRLGGQFRAVEGTEPWTSGGTCREPCVDREGKDQVSQNYTSRTPLPIPFPLRSYSPSVYCPLVPFVPVPTTWLEEIAESGRNKSFKHNPQIPPTYPDFPKG